MSRSRWPVRLNAVASSLVFAALLSAAPPALAQFTQQGAKLVGSGAIGNAEQGWSVAISSNGTTAAVGGVENDGGVGGVWIFTRTGSTWSQQTATPLMATGAGVAQQGSAVALSADGNTLIVGGWDYDTSGATWVFTRSGNTWTEQAGPLIGSGATGNASQGGAVALSADGNTAVVGGSGDNGGIGAAWIWTRSGGTWTQVGTKLFGTGAVGNALQGASVAISGDASTVLIGGGFDNSFVGAAWVFTQSGGVWSQQGSKLVGTGFATSIATGVLQGASVALSNNGNTAMVGGPADNFDNGAAWVFTRSGSTWTQTGSKLTPSDNSGAAQFGSGVSLSSAGNLATIGGGLDNNNTGAAWVFGLNGGAWTQQQPKLVGTGFAGIPNEGDRVALSSDGSTFLASGVNDDSNGAVWVFAQPVPTLSTISPAIGPTLGGTSVTLTGTNFLGATAVSFGSSPAASFTVSSASSITATSPPGVGTVNVVVTTPLGTTAISAADQFSYEPSHDFNGDGKSDVLWRDTSNNIGMWLMNGATTLQNKVLGAVPSTWAAVGQRDFNGAGNSDVLWRDASGNVAIWLMNGTQIVSSNVLGQVPTTWSVAATGDFNADGKGDIVWRDTSGNIGLWLMNGTTILQTATLGNLSTNWIIAGADMKGEIFWRNLATGEVGIWLVNGTAIAQTVDFGVVPLTWTIAGLGDFDGNGSTDILWRDSSGNVGIWLMNGLQIMSTKVLGNVPLTWTIAQTGDYGGNGKSDIFWLDNLGNVGVWFMNGTAISSTTIYGNVGTAWSVQSLNAD